MKSTVALLCIFLVSGFILIRCHVVKTLDPNLVIVVPTPSDNLQSDAKIALGRSLFFDKRLSLDGTISCATCHDPKKGFNDQYGKVSA